MKITKQYLIRNIEKKLPRMMAKEKNVSADYIRKRIRKFNLKPPPQKVIRTNYILANYKNKSKELLAKELKMSEDYIDKIFKKLNLDVSDNKKYHLSKRTSFLGGVDFLKACKEHNCKNNFELREKLGHEKFMILAEKIRKKRKIRLKKNAIMKRKKSI